MSDALELYEKLGVKHQPLKVISPNFEAPLPPLQAAVSYLVSYNNFQNNEVKVETAKIFSLYLLINIIIIHIYV